MDGDPYSGPPLSICGLLKAPMIGISQLGLMSKFSKGSREYPVPKISKGSYKEDPVPGRLCKQHYGMIFLKKNASDNSEFIV